jgi:RES domain-containing protein
MTPLPAALGGSELVVWRIDQAGFAATWDSGEGAYRVGGRWNSRGVRAVYCAVDPATAILEVAVHKGFRALDVVPHVLTAAVIGRPAEVHVVDPAALPNPNWLRPGIPSAGQQAFGDDLLRRHTFVALPSAVSPHSWNLVFDATARGRYAMMLQEAFALDPRLHPPETQRD